MSTPLGSERKQFATRGQMLVQTQSRNLRTRESRSAEIMVKLPQALAETRTVIADWKGLRAALLVLLLMSKVVQSNSMAFNLAVSTRNQIDEPR